jgi:hypothetical protein
MNALRGMAPGELWLGLAGVVWLWLDGPWTRLVRATRKTSEGA